MSEATFKQLRKGKTKVILESSIDSALLGVEIYNKPRTTFRSEGFITLMVIAWTRLFHAYFNSTIGDKYYYKNPNGRYELTDGEKKAWDLSKCIKEYKNLSEAVKSNLIFFIKLRNKIEHRHVEKREIDTLIFGECQSFLYNYENQLIELFGSSYSINEALVYSLQFSQIRTKKQEIAGRSALSKDLSDIVNFVDKYKNSLDDATYDSQEYSIKLIQIPKISNTNRADAAIEFVQWDRLSDDDKNAYEKIAVLIKDKKVKIEAANVGRLKPGSVVSKVNEKLVENKISQHIHTCLHKIFNIRPPINADDPFRTDIRFCHYDQAHNDYVYNDQWVDFIINLFVIYDLNNEFIKKECREKRILEVDDYNNL